MNINQYISGLQHIGIPTLDLTKKIIEARGRMSTKPEYVTMVYDKFMKLLGDHAKIQTEMKKINDFRYATVLVPNKK